jgi:hypothetical protein
MARFEELLSPKAAVNKDLWGGFETWREWNLVLKCVGKLCLIKERRQNSGSKTSTTNRPMGLMPKKKDLP